MTITKIPAAELKVMKFIWGKNATVTSKETIEIMEHKYGWKQTTTLTLLSRLVKKHFLDAEKIDRYTHYTIAVKEEDYLNIETKEFLNTIHNNSMKSLLTALHNDDEISKENMEIIEEWLNGIKE